MESQTFFCIWTWTSRLSRKHTHQCGRTDHFGIYHLSLVFAYVLWSCLMALLIHSLLTIRGNPGLHLIPTCRESDHLASVRTLVFQLAALPHTSPLLTGLDVCEPWGWERQPSHQLQSSDFSESVRNLSFLSIRPFSAMLLYEDNPLLASRSLFLPSTARMNEPITH